LPEEQQPFSHAGDNIYGKLYLRRYIPALTERQSDVPSPAAVCKDSSTQTSRYSHRNNNQEALPAYWPAIWSLSALLPEFPESLHWYRPPSPRFCIPFYSRTPQYPPLPVPLPRKESASFPSPHSHRNQ